MLLHFVILARLVRWYLLMHEMSAKNYTFRQSQDGSRQTANTGGEGHPPLSTLSRLPGCATLYVMIVAAPG